MRTLNELPNPDDYNEGDKIYIADKYFTGHYIYECKPNQFLNSENGIYNHWHYLSYERSYHKRRRRGGKNKGKTKKLLLLS